METMTETNVIRCPACGQMNRVDQQKVARGLSPVCGRCRTELPVASRPVEVSDATFAAEVEGSTLPVVVDMWAPWCGPCRMISPILDELASEMAGRVRFVKLNVDENPVTASRFRVGSIPTLLVLQGGRVRRSAELYACGTGSRSRHFACRTGHFLDGRAVEAVELYGVDGCVGDVSLPSK